MHLMLQGQSSKINFLWNVYWVNSLVWPDIIWTGAFKIVQKLVQFFIKNEMEINVFWFVATKNI